MSFHHDQRIPLGIRDHLPLALIVLGDQEGHVGVALEELGVVELFLHHDLHQRQHEGQVGARADLDPLVRLGGGLRAARVERDHLGAVLAALGEAHHAAGRHRTDGGVVGDEQDVLGVVEVRQISSWMLKLPVTTSVPRWPVVTQCCMGEATMLGTWLAMAKGTAQFM